MAAAIPPDQVRAELEKILASQGFVDAGRLGPFLRYLVEKVLDGEAAVLKESVIGSDVFQREPTYDPRLDPIVRVEARRLRSRLADYYEKRGAGAPVRIDLPKGSYVPVFTAAAPSARRTRPPSRRATVIVGIILMAAALAGLFYRFGRMLYAVPGRPSIAVLPFLNLSPDPANEYFSDGLTEELIDSLTKIESLQVAARSSCFQFKGKPVDIRDVGHKLNVTTILEGSVRKSGDRLRVTAQLINVADGYHLWSETYERELKDVFAIQAEISQAIANALKVKLNPNRAARPARRYTEHVEAYNLYLKGRYTVNQYSTGGVFQGIDYFNQAVAADPSYAPAYAMLAHSHMLLGYYRIAEDQHAWEKSRKYAEQAIRLDPGLAEAHSALGFALAWHDWKWEEAEAELKRALELDPGSADARGAYAIAYLAPTGRIQQATAELKKALELDPNSALNNMAAAYSFLVAGRYDEAIAQYRRTLEIMPHRSNTWWDLGMAYGFKGDFTAAMEAFRKAGGIDEGRRWEPGAIELALVGRMEEARALAAKRGEKYYDKIRAIHAAYSFSYLGDRDRAFRYFDRAMIERDPEVIWLKVDLRLKNLRDDPRAVPYLKRLGF